MAESRRDFLGLLVRTRPDYRRLPTFARPPGARAESRFLADCDSCGKCRDACPHSAIAMLGVEYGRAADTPAILPERDPCRLCDDLPCITACPTGALRKVPRDRIRMGSVAAEASNCWAASGQRCDYCVTACPLPEPAVRVSSSGPAIDVDACTGCGACIHYCTALPRALRLIPR